MPSYLKTLPVSQDPQNQTVLRPSGWFVLEYRDAKDRRHLIQPGELDGLVGGKLMDTCLSRLQEMSTLDDPPRSRHEIAIAYQKPREALGMNNGHLPIARNPKVVALPEQVRRATNVWAASPQRMGMPVNRLPAGTLSAAECHRTLMTGRSLESPVVMVIVMMQLVSGDQWNHLRGRACA